jgi:hypothetical protein
MFILKNLIVTCNNSFIKFIDLVSSIISQLSIDYCVQEVSTLWGSFEIFSVVQIIILLFGSCIFVYIYVVIILYDL